MFQESTPVEQTFFNNGLNSLFRMFFERFGMTFQTLVFRGTIRLRLNAIIMSPNLSAFDWLTEKDFGPNGLA